MYSVCLECATKKWRVFDPNEKRITVHFYFSPKVADLEKLYGEKITKNQMIKILRVGTFNIKRKSWLVWLTLHLILSKFPDKKKILWVFNKCKWRSSTLNMEKIKLYISRSCILKLITNMERPLELAMQSRAKTIAQKLCFKIW